MLVSALMIVLSPLLMLITYPLETFMLVAMLFGIHKVTRRRA